MRVLGIAAAMVVIGLGLYNAINYERELTVNKKDATVRRRIYAAMKSGDIASIRISVCEFSNDELVHFSNLCRESSSYDSDTWASVINCLDEELVRRGL